MITIPASPFPRINELFHVLWTHPSSGNLWTENAKGKTAKFFSRGMWALNQAVNILLKENTKDRGLIWIPDYFCNEALTPLRKQRHNFFFYPVREDLEPDWNLLEQKHEEVKKRINIFILAHYFGFANNVKKTITFCELRNIAVIEDAAHVITPGFGIGQNKSMTVFSPRKLLAVPEGGILTLPSEMPVGIGFEASEGNYGNTCRWLGRRVAQQILVFLNIPWHSLSGSIRCNTDRSEDIGMKFTLSDSSCSRMGRKFLSVMGKNIDQIISRRRNHYNLLLKGISNFKSIRALWHSLPEGICPYAFPLVAEFNRDHLLAQLCKHGIQAGTWPDLPGEVTENPQLHKVAIWLQKSIILLPVHQCLTQRQINYMLKIMSEIFR